MVVIAFGTHDVNVIDLLCSRERIGRPLDAPRGHTHFLQNSSLRWLTDQTSLKSALSPIGCDSGELPREAWGCGGRMVPSGTWIEVATLPATMLSSAA